MVAIEAYLTLLVIFIALALFISEVVTVDLAALIVMSLLMALGLVTPVEGISGFANPATITVLAMFILSAGVERTGAVNLLAHVVARIAGKREWGQILAIVLIVAPVSAFINNTAAVAIMIPMVIGLGRDQGIAPSKLLMPLSFAAMLGGMVTLIGTSTNLLASSISADLGYGAFGLFEFAAPGIIVALIGIVYLLTVGRWLLPDHGAPLSERFNVPEYLGEVTVPAESRAGGKRLAELELPDRYGVRIVAVRRRGIAIDPGLDPRLVAGDVLVLLGVRSKLLELASLEGLSFQPREDSAEAAPEPDETELFEVAVTPQSRLVGQTLEKANFSAWYGGTVVAARKPTRFPIEAHVPFIGRAHVPLARAHIHEGDVLLIAGTTEDKERCLESEDLLLLEELKGRTFKREKMGLALIVFAGVVAFAALGVADILVTSIVGAALMAIVGVLSMDELHRSIRWDVLFLLAGMIPLGIAMQRSGLSVVVADLITNAGATQDPLITLMLLFAVTSLLTNFMSNNASAILLVPVAAATAVALGHDPKVYMLTVAFAASASFATPLGYQTNTMIYGPGQYSFKDYLRVGLPLNLIMVVAAPYVLLEFFPV